MRKGISGLVVIGLIAIGLIASSQLFAVYFRENCEQSIVESECKSNTYEWTYGYCIASGGDGSMCVGLSQSECYDECVSLYGTPPVTTTTTPSDDLCSNDNDCCDSSTDGEYVDCYYSSGAGGYQCRWSSIYFSGYTYCDYSPVTTIPPQPDLCDNDVDCCNQISFRYVDCYYSSGANRKQCRGSTSFLSGYYECFEQKCDDFCVGDVRHYGGYVDSSGFCNWPNQEICSGGCEAGKCIECIGNWETCNYINQLLGQEECCSGSCEFNDVWGFLFGDKWVCVPDSNQLSGCEDWCKEIYDNPGWGPKYVCCGFEELCEECDFCKTYNCDISGCTDASGKTYSEGEVIQTNCAQGSIIICRGGVIVTINRAVNEELFCDHCPEVCDEGCPVQGEKCSIFNPCCSILDDQGNRLICEPPLSGVCQFEDIACLSEGRDCKPDEGAKCCTGLECLEEVFSVTGHRCKKPEEPNPLVKLLEDYPWLLIIIPAVVGYFLPKTEAKKKKGLIIGGIVGFVMYYMYIWYSGLSRLEQFLLQLGVGTGSIGGIAIFLYLGGGVLIMYYITRRKK